MMPYIWTASEVAEMVVDFAAAMPYLWVVVLIASILFEAATMSLVAVWFIPGTLAALVMSFCHVDAVWQIVVFAVCALFMLTLGRLLFRPMFKKTKTNVSALIGQTALITQAVNNIEARGEAKLGGQLWTARAADASQELLPGDVVEIVAIEGVKLICRKK